MMVQSKSVEDHVKDLRECFGQGRKYNMRLNPAKCMFNLGAGKFLGFMLTAREFKVNLYK